MTMDCSRHKKPRSYLRPSWIQLGSPLLFPLQSQRIVTPYIMAILAILFGLWQDCPDKKKLKKMLSLLKQSDVPQYLFTCLSTAVSSRLSAPPVWRHLYQHELELWKKARLSLKTLKHNLSLWQESK